MTLYWFLTETISEENNKNSSNADLDRRCLRKFLDGDNRGFLDIFNRYHQKIFNFIHGFIRNREAAEDLTQETFARFIKGIDRFDFKYAPSTLLFNIAKRQSINFINSSDFKNRISVEQEYLTSFQDSGNSQEKNLMIKETEMILNKCINNLQPKLKTVLILKKDNSFTYDEIATHLNISVSTAKRRLKAGIAFLHTALKQEGIDLEHIL